MSSPAHDNNVYAPPAAAVLDVVAEDSIRRDGQLLVFNIGGGLHSCCAVCGSLDTLQTRNPLALWRHPIGCFGTLAIGIGVIGLVIGAQSLPASLRPFVLWVIWGAPVLVIILNLVFRSRRFRLHYALCGSCRHRRARWFRRWTGLIVIAVLMAFLSHAFALVAVPLLYMLCTRLQPAHLTARRVRNGRVWLRGAGVAVLQRFKQFNEEIDS